VPARSDARSGEIEKDCNDFQKVFARKNLAKKLPFFAQTTARFCKNMIVKLVFEKTPFFAEKWQKSLKIVIITPKLFFPLQKSGSKSPEKQAITLAPFLCDFSTFSATGTSSI
jgi:hypothetical protein